ncbi:MAG: hypothetical protein P4M14_02635 [Gammaproteobacteria bacterium]|nr:hypothetical protein [Gammaproteobacteria bacterium]
MPFTVAQFKNLFNVESKLAIDMINGMSSRELETLLASTTNSELEAIKNSLSEEDKAALVPFNYAKYDDMTWKDSPFIFLRRHLSAELLILILSRFSRLSLNAFLISTETERYSLKISGLSIFFNSQTMTGLDVFLGSSSDDLHLYLTRALDPMIIKKAFSLSNPGYMMRIRLSDETHNLYDNIIDYMYYPEHSLKYKTEGFLLFLNQQIMRLDFSLRQGSDQITTEEFESWMAYIDQVTLAAKHYPEVKKSLELLRSLYRSEYINRSLSELSFKEVYQFAINNSPDTFPPNNAFIIGLHIYSYQQDFSAEYREGLSLWRRFFTTEEKFNKGLSQLYYDFLRSAAARGSMDAKRLLLRIVASRADNNVLSKKIDGFNLDVFHQVEIIYPPSYADLEKTVAAALIDLPSPQPFPVFELWKSYKLNVNSAATASTFKPFQVHPYLQEIDDLLSVPPLDVDEAFVESIRKMLREKIDHIDDLPKEESKKILSILTLLQNKIDAINYIQKNILRS